MIEALDRMQALRQRHGDLGATQQDLYDQIMVMAALELGALPRVRQLIKARLSIRVWDEASWQACETRARRIDEESDLAAVRAELRWRRTDDSGRPTVSSSSRMRWRQVR